MGEGKGKGREWHDKEEEVMEREERQEGGREGRKGGREGGRKGGRTCVHGSDGVGVVGPRHAAGQHFNHGAT